MNKLNFCLFCFFVLVLFSCSSVSKRQNEAAEYKNDSEMAQYLKLNPTTSMCVKEEMQADGIIRLAKIEVYPQYLEEYLEYATEVGEISLRTEPGVLTMYAISEKQDPCKITILETYANASAYESHIATAHFQKYKQGTLHMVKNLVLSDQTSLNSSNVIVNYIK